MALNKLKFNSLNVTPAASEGIRFNSSANGLETASAGGSLVKLASTTASSDSSVSFTSGIDSTYKEYIFFFNNISVATNGQTLTFNGSIDGGSNYNVTKTSSAFSAYQNESGSTTSLGYTTAYDQAQGTGFQTLAGGIGNGSDESASGFLHIFEPSSTTFVKHYISRVNYYEESDYTVETNIAGYFNTTSAVNAIQFKLLSGNFSGTITMYGVS
tara:strand:+ start:480 stop:1121 length:642 start_codon:yes stop_codon:yes gene_type:complete